MAEVDRRDARLELANGIRVLLTRADLVLEFLLNGPSRSVLVGDKTGDVIVWLTPCPSGMICGETVSLVLMLSIESVILLLEGETGDFGSPSVVGDIVDADVRDAAGAAWSL